KGALPTSRGMRPVIGPPFAADAGVSFVRLAPSKETPTQRSGVMPWTWALATPAKAPLRMTTRPKLARIRRIERTSHCYGYRCVVERHPGRDGLPHRGTDYVGDSNSPATLVAGDAQAGHRAAHPTD